MSKRRILIIASSIGILPLLAGGQAMGATSSVQSSICKDFVAPSIVTPSSVKSTAATSSRIDGTGQAGMTVTLLNNGIGVGATIIASDGLFGAEIPLGVGENTIQVREADACQTKQSGTIVLRRSAIVIPPTDSDSTSSRPEVSKLPGRLPAPGGTNDVSTDTAEDAMTLLITSPLEGATITCHTVPIQGMTAPHSIVDLYVNQRAAARIIADETGSFGAVVALEPGDNTIRAHATSPGGTPADGTVLVHGMTTPLTHESGSLWIILITAAITLLIVVVSLLLLYARGWRLVNSRR